MVVVLVGAGAGAVVSAATTVGGGVADVVGDGVATTGEELTTGAGVTCVAAPPVPAAVGPHPASSATDADTISMRSFKTIWSP
ncbi:hypothetical protein [Dactylosporangium sp. CA-139066]|uniref:hypothetical protein n=1 Tax=Dactylosporangium sp. CA-139066 TaxID=3239930 RepID=UPI003D926753